MKLNAFISRRLTRLHLKYKSSRIEEARDGSKITIFTLKTPIKEVKGSQRYSLGSMQGTYNGIDVDEVRVSDRLVDIQVDNRKKTVWAPLGYRLDVSKRGDVWIVDKSFELQAHEMRTIMRAQRVHDILSGKE